MARIYSQWLGFAVNEQFNLGASTETVVSGSADGVIVVRQIQAMFVTTWDVTLGSVGTLIQGGYHQVQYAAEFAPGLTLFGSSPGPRNPSGESVMWEGRIVLRPTDAIQVVSVCLDQAADAVATAYVSAWGYFLT